jgi:hypothetical protein
LPIIDNRSSYLELFECEKYSPVSPGRHPFAGRFHPFGPHASALP